eukprot:CAMPEP_0118922528 /NCGR_PEP_ID=MMETSP1169-20130426/1430_1 /TAXON_ID=36882 /ORGANISM="Pyramimonas obovata, Strain CCMP722" /LENGTH=188 /DNA_ID=CAMNT_0006863419 /DNA_START=105 /DNA_END=671 /DNA_ORIENTATION=+
MRIVNARVMTSKYPRRLHTDITKDRWRQAPPKLVGARRGVARMSLEPLGVIADLAVDDVLSSVSTLVASGPQEAITQIATTSNLGFIDPGVDVPPADWAPAQAYASGFEPEVRVDPPAIFASLLLLLLGLDATLQSMNVPFIGSRIGEYLRAKRKETKDREYEEFQQEMRQRELNNEGGQLDEQEKGQ